MAVDNWSKFRASSKVATPNIFKTTPVNTDLEIIVRHISSVLPFELTKQLFLITSAHKQGPINESSTQSQARNNTIQDVNPSDIRPPKQTNK